MPRGRKVYIRGKKERPGDGMMWPEKKKMEALTTYLAVGTLPLTSAVTNVPVETLKYWKRSAWWAEAMKELQYEDNIAISAKLNKVLEKSLAAVEDRLENGEYMYDPRTGDVKRIPAKLRDVHKVTTDIVDKKQQLLKLHIKDEVAQPQQVTADHLVQLAQAFAQFATGKAPTLPNPTEVTNEIIEGECEETLDQLGYDVGESTTAEENEDSVHD